MFVFCRPSGTVADDRARSSPTDVSVRFRFARFRNRVKITRNLCQLVGLAWIVGAIGIYPFVERRREREARQAIRELGGRFHFDENPLADWLPNRVANWYGWENLHSIRSVNLSHCDPTDDDVEKLLRFRSLEQVNLCGCRRVTTEGAARLWTLPRMKLVWVDGMSIDDASRCLMGEPIAAAAGR
ncbi:MAG TPA: hypothetical protein VFI31_30345 [Pirellulales bacterium]|nr:hypothetical protein [Pirellulales bacterium]